MQLRKFRWNLLRSNLKSEFNSPLHIAIWWHALLSDPYLLTTFFLRGTSTASSPFPTAPGAGRRVSFYRNCSHQPGGTSDFELHGDRMGYVSPSYKMIWGLFESRLASSSAGSTSPVLSYQTIPLKSGYLYTISYNQFSDQMDLHVPWSILMHLLRVHGVWSSKMPAETVRIDDDPGLWFV